MSAPLTAIDLGLVEEGIEIGKKIMAEVIAAYPKRARARQRRRGARGRRAIGAWKRATATRTSTSCGSPKQEYCGRPRQGSSGPGRRQRLPQRGELAERATQARRQSRALIRASTDSIVSSYRFCRTDDVSLLVDALNRCWSPHFPDEPAMTPATFKRSIRDLQVWCSSCMVAFSGPDPIGSADRRETAFRHPHSQDRRPSRSLSTGSWPSPAHLAQLEARDSRPAENGRRDPRDSRADLRAVRRKRICPGSGSDGLRP